MDINSIGLHQLNSTIPFSSAQQMLQAQEGSGGFENILRRLQTANPGGADSSERNLNTPPIVKNHELYELCLELETILMKNLIKGMRSTIQKTNLIDTGMAGEIYEDMLYDEYAKTFTRSARLGLAEMAYRELSGQR